MKQSKIVALDLGQAWIGSALSDASRMFAKPYKTVTPKELITFLNQLLAEEPIDTIVVGHPRTMKGTASEQTLLVEQQFAKLKDRFPALIWVLWDERLSSKRAAQQRTERTKEERQKGHSIAAAFILDSYLNFLSAQQTQ
jgi:putative Holliday junction resolvase